MANAIDRATCVNRHRGYSIDIAGRLGGRGSFQRQRIERMVRPIKPGERVLDVGCNSGYLVDFLPRGCRCSGVDVSNELVKKARKRLESAEVCEAEALPFDDSSFDVVVLGEIIEHVCNPAIVLGEAMRVARRAVVGSTPHEDGKWGSASVARHRFHVRCYTERTLRAELRSVGLVNVKVSTVSRNGVGQIYVFSGDLCG